MPEEYKLALLLPHLKKLGLELIKRNYRPVSNLPYVSKLIERCVCYQLVDHMKENKLFEKLQSAYCEGRSTETALLSVKNDITLAMDEQQLTALVLLDLSAAFDTVDHQILLGRLSDRVGVKGHALKWLTSYLTGRRQQVLISGVKSEPVSLTCGVPQGSVLGPVLFTIYTLPLGDIIRSHDLKYHLYADDTQLYLSFQSRDVDQSLSRIESCISDIQSWMVRNRLKLNGDKTELLFIGTPQQQAKLCHPSISIGESAIQPSESARNLGVIFDQSMTLKAHISSVSKTAYHQLYNISVARKWLNRKAAATAIQAFVTSRLDFSNSLYYGLPNCDIIRLQRIQDAAARTLTGTKKGKRAVEKIRKDIHWLPVRQRIEYKVLLIAFKAMQGIAPPYVADLLHPYKPSCGLRSGTSTLLRERKTSLVTGGDRSFVKAAPLLWNQLPESLCAAESASSFKGQLKTHLFKKAYNC